MQKYRRVLNYARPCRGWFVWLFVLTAATSVIAALQPWPMKILVDNVLGEAVLPGILQDFFQSIQAAPSPGRVLVFVVVAVLILFACQSLLDVGLAWGWTVAGRRMVYDLTHDLFARLQRRSILFHSRTPVGDSLSRVTVDSWCVHRLFDGLIFTPAQALLTIAAMLFLMAQLNGTLTLLAGVVAPLMVSASLLMGRPLRATAKLKREVESRIQSHIQQTLTGIPVVQGYVQEEREHRQFDQYAETAIRVQQRSELLGSVNSLSSGLIVTMGNGVILWVGANFVLTGQLTIGSILVFLVYLNTLQGQLKLLAGTYTNLQGISASVDRVNEVFEAAPDLVQTPDAPPLHFPKGRIRFENVVTGYAPGQPVLHGISFAAEPGELTAIAGASGSGKSTLTGLIPRFMDAWEGRVLLDEQDVRGLDLKSLREHVSVVMQEPFLFPVSVAENIAYGNPAATRAEIEEAARAASAHEFISQLPGGYGTIIGERGITLSGGERQRLALARAFLKRAPILILDEPASALDSATEHALLEALERVRRERTTFVIAHRLSTIRQADRILFLKEGRIVENGTHDELMRAGGLYAGFVARQFPAGKEEP
jgi:ATP-binding cassette, subfamily B, bacterial